MAGYDPRLVNQALAMQGGSFRIPLPGEVQPLTPAEQSFGQQVAAAQDAQAAQAEADAAAAGYTHGGMAAPAPSVQPIGLDWQPKVAPAQPAPSRAAQEPAQQPSAGEPMRWPGAARGAGGGGGSNPLPGMITDATDRRRDAEKRVSEQESAGDYASASLEQSAEDISTSRAEMYSGISDIQRRQAEEGEAYQRQLVDMQDSHVKASAKTQQEARELTSFVGSYQPKDRRSMGERVTGALAVAFSGLADQANLVAGLNAGMNIQTNRAGQMMDMIQRSIDRDLEKQRMMLDNKRTALAAKNTELGQIREKFGDSVDTLKLGRAMKLEQAAQEVEALKSRGLSAEQAAVADQTIAGLRLDRANMLQGISEQRFQQHFGDEQRLKVARYNQQQAAAAAQARANQPMSTKEALELEGKALDNEGKRRELAGGGTGKPLSAEQLKRQSFLTGVEESARGLAAAVAGGEAAPGAWGRNTPDMLRGTQAIELETNINALKGILLRDESGASISEEDQKAKIAGWGIERGDEASRRRGLRLMLDEYNARRASTGLAPIQPIVRRGAR